MELVLDGVKERGVVVGDRTHPIGLCTALARRRDEHEAVGIVDLSWLKRLAWFDQLRSRRNHGDARLGIHANGAVTARRQQRDLTRLDQRAGGKNHGS